MPGGALRANAAARFWDRIAERYARQPIADEAAYQRKLQVTRGYFRPDMEVLELGCGTGSTALLHAPYVKRIQAVDFSSKMIEIARRKAEAAGIANVGFARSAIDELGVPDGSADAVLALSLLHLLEDQDAVIARVYRMLKPGGVFVTSTACIGDFTLPFRLVMLVAPVGRLLGLMPLVKAFTSKELEGSLTGAGFAIDHKWQPARNKALFVVAKKPG